MATIIDKLETLGGKLKSNFIIGEQFQAANVNRITSFINKILGVDVDSSGNDHVLVVARASADENGNSFSTTYATQETVTDLVSGDTIVKSAEEDGAGNNIVNTYSHIYTNEPNETVEIKPGDIKVIDGKIYIYNGTIWILMNSWQ